MTIRARSAPAQEIRAVLSHLHDLPYLQTHPLRGLRGKDLQRALTEALATLGQGRRAELLRLRYGEALESREVAARLGISQGEYYREHGQALAAVASVLADVTTIAPPTLATSDIRAHLGRLAPLTSFIGRDDEIDQVLTLLGEARLVTVAGPGGVGKTRLTLAAAERARLPGGTASTYFVELAPLDDEALLPGAVAAALGVSAQRDATRELVEWLGERTALVILDNCEHLIGACASLADTLLRGCARLRILSTSREPLGVPGEVIYRLGPLAPDDAARLFTDRARLVRPTFALDRANESAVGQICRLVDGLPLALELAAARVVAFSPTEIAERLDALLDSPADGGRGRPERHRTVRATVEWSYDLLSVGEQALFRRLAVFAGGFMLDAAEAVSPGAATAVALAQLVVRSLIVAEELADGRTRYRVLEPVRQIALERLRSLGEEDVARARHLEFLVGLAERIEPGMWARGDEAESIAALGVEEDNLRAALDWALEHDHDLALRLAAALARFWRRRGSWLEGRSRLVAALERTPEEHPRRAAALVGAAALTRDLSGGAEPAMGVARSLAAEALPLARASGDDRSVALALNELVATSGQQGAARQAEIARDMLSHCRATQFAWGTIAALNHLGFAAQRTGDLAEARSLFERALDEAVRSGSRQSQSATLSYLGGLAFEQGDIEGASSFLERSRQTGSPMADYLSVQADAALAHGDLAAAEDQLRERLRLTRRIVSAPMPLASLHLLGVVSARRGQTVRAARLMGAVAALATRPGAGTVPAAWIDRLGGSVQGPAAVGAREAGEKRLGEDHAAVRRALEPTVFAAAWAEGEAMTFEETISYALAEEDV